METCNHLYILRRLVGGVEELLDWDQGRGIHHPDFMDVLVPEGAPDPVNFTVSMTLAEQKDDLGLGQVDAPMVARVEMEVEEMEDILGVLLRIPSWEAGVPGPRCLLTSLRWVIWIEYFWNGLMHVMLKCFVWYFYV